MTVAAERMAGLWGRGATALVIVAPRCKLGMVLHPRVPTPVPPGSPPEKPPA